MLPCTVPWTLNAIYIEVSGMPGVVPLRDNIDSDAKMILERS